MTRNEFLTQYWRYYLSLERDFIQLTRYVGLYKENFNVFSDEIHKQFSSVGIEFENISKQMREILNIPLTKEANIKEFKQWIPKIEIKVVNIYSLNHFNLLPFEITNKKIYLKWWNSYNGIKHNRLFNYKEVTFKNLLDALSALFYAEMFLIREIGEKNNDVDVPDEYSKLFAIEDWETKHSTCQVGNPFATNEDIDALFPETNNKKLEEENRKSN